MTNGCSLSITCDGNPRTRDSIRISQLNPTPPHPAIARANRAPAEIVTADFDLFSLSPQPFERLLPGVAPARMVALNWRSILMREPPSTSPSLRPICGVVGGFAPLRASGFRLCGLRGKMASFRKSLRRSVLSRSGGNPGLSRKGQIRACAAKRGLPQIPAFGIGWLYLAVPGLPTADTPPVARLIFIPPDEVLPHNATDTTFPAQFAGN
jgi:hypothetical protein